MDVWRVCGDRRGRTYQSGIRTLNGVPDGACWSCRTDNDHYAGAEEPKESQCLMTVRV